MRSGAQTLCAAGVISFCACGLDKNGLFDLDGGSMESVTGSENASGPADDGLAQAFVPDATGGAGVDARDGSAAPYDGTTAQDETPTVDDATVDAYPDALADAYADATVDTYGGAIVDVNGDAMTEAGGTADGTSDSGSLPIVWDGGPIVDPQFSASDWTSFCVALAGCGQVTSISACMGLLRQPSSPDALFPPPSLVLSVNNVGADCARVGQLLGNGSACSAATPDSCTGNSLVTCRWGFRMTIDCGPLGMVCSAGNGSAGCGFGDCSQAQQGKTYCVGPSELVGCSEGRYRPLLSCQTFGATCAGPAETAGCLGTGGSGCTGAPVCSGVSIVECLGGLLGSADCSSLYGSGFTCTVDDAGSPTCAAGASCVSTSNVDTCMGNTASFCSAGATATYDCSSNGWRKGCTGGRCIP